ncbi:MAG: metal-dependent transcriptional regulator [bacterium]
MSEKVDHLLRAIWLMQEQDQTVDSERVFPQESDADHTTAKFLEENDFISLKNGIVTLLPKGRQKAETLIRGHLLAERLLSDVLQVSEKEMTKSACAFEHILSPEVTDSVCTFLGHPPVCPHGITIPRGKCCLKFTTQIRPLVHRLKDMEIGEQASIVFIAPGREKTLERLAIFGMVPGNCIRLEQKKPAYVIQVDETVLALEPDLCKGIYVKKANGDPSQFNREKGNC